MKILKLTVVEDCLDGAFIYEVALDSPLTLSNVRQLTVMGKLELFENLPIPFFRLMNKDFYLKGVVGKTTFKLVLTNLEWKLKLDNLIERLGELLTI
ncbi:MAG: hypothetical protein ACOX5W_08115 [Bacillota bacterium]|jgi:hypothetical protein